MMKVMNIINDSIVDGTGLRTVIFFSGCPHQCEFCHNPSSWNINNGTDLSIDEILSQIPNHNNVTFSGGEPFVQEKKVIELAKILKLKGKNIWCYTGYNYEDIKDRELLNYIDVLVDGRFEIDKRDLTLRFRGSSNQRVIDVRKTLATNEINLLLE